MKIVKLDGDDPVRLACEGDLTPEGIPPGRDLLLEAIGPIGYSARVLLSVERSNYINSNGISWLLVAQKHFLQGGGKLVIHSAPPMIDQVLRLLKMQLVLTLAVDEAAARSALGGKP